MELAKKQGLTGHSMLNFMEINSKHLEVSITQSDLIQAIKRVGKSIGSSDFENFSKWEKEFGST